jgi:tetrapyrrole methylase family protein / MazG family protein
LRKFKALLRNVHNFSLVSPVMSNLSSRAEQLAAFDRLLTIMDELRAQCPWDQKQTTESLRHLTIEETFELSDAILEGNPEEIKKELGDILLHIVFYAKIGSEEGNFDIATLTNALCEKLIRRHPHIYGDTVANDADTVSQNWEKIKLKEKGNVSVLGGVPKSLPALIKAMRIQEKARGVGFDWEEKSQVWEKVEEEMQEFKSEFNAAEEKEIDREKATGEFGDLLFSLINYARFIEINPEEALERTNLKFIKRFQYLEKAAKESGRNLSDMTLAEMDVYWNEAKKK